MAFFSVAIIAPPSPLQSEKSMRTQFADSPPNTARSLSSVAFSDAPTVVIACRDARISRFSAPLTMERLSLKDGRMATPPFRPRSA